MYPCSTISFLSVGGVFIDQNFAKNFEQKKLDCPLTAKNVDGTINKKGTIENYVDLEFKIHSRNNFASLD